MESRRSLPRDHSYTTWWGVISLLSTEWNTDKHRKENRKRNAIRNHLGFQLWKVLYTKHDKSAIHHPLIYIIYNYWWQAVLTVIYRYQIIIIKWFIDMKLSMTAGCRNCYLKSIIKVQFIIHWHIIIDDRLFNIRVITSFVFGLGAVNYISGDDLNCYDNL